MNDIDRPPTDRSLRPPRWLPFVGAALGAAAGFAFYWFYGCDSG